MRFASVVINGYGHHGGKLLGVRLLYLFNWLVRINACFWFHCLESHRYFAFRAGKITLQVLAMAACYRATIWALKPNGV